MPNVSEVTQQLIEIVRDNSGLIDVWIQGEIADVNHARNGNAYFTIKDPLEKIECVIFNNPKNPAPIQRNLPTVGNNISINGQIDIYRTRSEYRFVVRRINSPENPLPVQPISVSTLTETWKNTLEAHSGEVQGEISEVFVTRQDYTILKLKDITLDEQANEIIECVLQPGITPPFPLQQGNRIIVKGKFGIFAKASAYGIKIDDANNITQVTEQPMAVPPLNECQDCRQRFSNLRDQLCHVCYYAHLAYEGIVVGAVQRYFNSPRFANFSTHREYEIRFGVNIIGRADLALLNSDGNPVAIAECKRIGCDGSDGIVQLEGYINPTVAKLGLFADNTDPYEWIFLKKNDKQLRFDPITRSEFERELGVEPAPEIPPTQTRLEIIQGNIVESEVDAVVNAADPNLTRGRGVDGAIRDAGGEEIERECQEIFDHQGVCPPGNAVITTGGNLSARHVIHAVGPIWQGGNRMEAESLADCYRNSLQLAVDEEIRSIAFPAISTGNFGFPIERAAHIALTTVKAFVEQAYQNNEMVPGRIQFVLFDEEAYTCYVKELSNLGFGLSCQIT